MEEPNFENNESLSSDKLETLARMYMIRNYPGSPITVTLMERENEELDNFLETANPEQINQVKDRAIFQRKYFTYVSKDAPHDKKDAIEQEMEEDPELKEYIESTYVWALAESYSMWVYGVEKAEKDLEGKIFDMTDEEIFTFFSLLEKYPDIVDQALAAMTSEIHAGPHKNSKFLVKPNENKYLSEREKLLELRDYFTGKMGQEERNNFHNEIIDNPNFRTMFVKMQNALK